MFFADMKSISTLASSKETDMKTLQINSNSIKVEDANGMQLLVARYDDTNGAYFFNQNLEKQYAKVDVSEVVYVVESGEFTFYVSAWRGDQIKTYTKTVKADNLAAAESKIERAYKSIYDYELALHIPK